MLATEMAQLVEQNFNFSPGANTDFFTPDLTPNWDASVYRVTVALDTAAVLQVRETQGGTTEEYDLNQGNSLGANQLFSFDVPVGNASTYNFQIDTNVGVQTFKVHEIIQTGP